MANKVSLLLLPEDGAEEKLEEMKNFLSDIHSLSFWKKYLLDKKNVIGFDKFSSGQWQDLPFTTKDDFLKNGLEDRLRDVNKNKEWAPNTFNLILRSTSGTTKSTVPLLFLNPVVNSYEVLDKPKEDAYRIISLQRSHMMGLRSTLLNIIKCSHKKVKSQALIVNSSHDRDKIYNVLEEYCADLIIGLPSSLSKFATDFFEKPGVIRCVRTVKLNGDFVSSSQLLIIRKYFGHLKNLNIGIEYAMTEFGKVGIGCQYLAKRYPSNAYHPGKFFLIELIDIDQDGYGEIVVTKMYPRELAVLRYQTGDIGRAVFEKCSCGAGVTLFLLGRKNFDYIKCAGTLIVRKEVERAIGKARMGEFVEEWRGEIREFVRGKEVCGELTIKIKLVPEFEMGETELSKLVQEVGENLFLTPNETLADLVGKEKFLPLKIEICKSFPEGPKKIILRKII